MLGALTPLAAQDLTITNVRIIGPNATVIERGSIVVRGGKIVSVAAGAPVVHERQGHRRQGHDARCPASSTRIATSTPDPTRRRRCRRSSRPATRRILSGGGPADGNITLRDHIESGQINGPRIIPSGQLRLNQHTPESARAEIRKMAAMGVKFTGEIALTPMPGPTEQEMDVLRAVVDEGKKAGVMVQVHAVSTPAMMAAVSAGVPLLVHLPNKDFTSDEDAKKLAASGTKILATIGFGAPVFGVFANDNKPRFRDGKDWPQSIVDGVRLGEEAGYMPVNARTVWDAGAILGYCTDTTYDPLAGLEHELKSFNMMFSMKDMIQIMGPNTASYIQMGDQLGTLEAGKIADIILLDGDPLEGYWNWLKTKVMIKGGVVVVDKR